MRQRQRNVGGRVMQHRQGPRTTVLLCLCVMVLEGFDIQVLGVAMPRLAPELGLSPAAKGWVLGLGNLGLLLGAVVGGWLADRFGRKPVLLGAVLAFGVSTLAIAWVNDFGTLCLMRLVAGLGFGAGLPNMMAIAAEVSTPERRILTTSVMFCGMPLGGGTSALLTQLLPPDFDWRLLFVIGGVLPLLLWPLLYMLLRETLPLQSASALEPARVSVRHAVFASGRAIPSLLLWCAALPTMFVLYLLLNWLPLLVVAKGFSPVVAPQASLVFNYASVVGALVFGLLVDRMGGRWILPGGFLLVIIGLLALGDAAAMEEILMFSGLTGFFLMGANYALYGLTASHYPAALRGSGSGAAVAVGRVGSVLGPLAPGLMLQAGMGADAVIVLMAPAAALAGLAVFAVSFYPDPREA